MAIAFGKKILPRVLKCFSDFGIKFLSCALLGKGNQIYVVPQSLENTMNLTFLSCILIEVNTYILVFYSVAQK
jgi:hypothetical protein